MFNSTADCILDLADETGGLSRPEIDRICRMHGETAEAFWMDHSDPDTGYSEDQRSAQALCNWLGY